MKLFWKGAAALSLAITGLGAAAMPAQAQYYGGNGWRGDRDRHWDRRGDHRRWDNRRGDDRRHWRGNRGWRGDRGYYRSNAGYRTRCWTEWRYDYYRDRNVRVRICR
ncbi:hypothetical protein ASE85_12670 [Sphingobium sp. Leaf26]|uniref:hypothetical protein n=1 Tax=Sphingobium sp. Leaf26 TaxID=1735693 RepID=UPI0006F2C677|nr:hypothetical protein [Sphingobium sp. Leaf26]KQM98688.1 hypothetical protein ASE85_12670 [Sphingobium sp. Leaf26]